jgi:hypothetical protein
MKIAFSLPKPDIKTPAQLPAEPEGKAAAAPPPDEVAATLEFSESSRAEKSAVNQKSPGPTDHSGRLTQRLVAASFQLEVHSIISEAYQNLSDWYKAAMGGGEDSKKAFAAIRRLNRLIQRAQRKIGDLDKEDLLRAERKRAEKQQQEHRAKQIEQDLSRRMHERKQREQRYLRSAGEQQGVKFPNPYISPAALQAKIAALAESMSQFSASPAMPVSASGGAGDVGGSGVVIPGEIAVAEAVIAE